MAEWRMRDPGSFPPQFHEAMRQGVGVDKLVSQRYTHRSILSDQIQWRLFRYCLRGHPGHPTAVNETSLMHRTRIRWNEDSRLWELLLTSRRTVLEDMEI
jgi:hypothetical protein